MRTAYISQKTTEHYRLDEKGLPYRVQYNLNINCLTSEKSEIQPKVIPHQGQLQGFQLYNLLMAN